MGNSNALNLNKIKLCESLSNALLKSVNTQSTWFFDSNELRQKLENSNTLEVIDLPLMKPCWWLEISL